MGTRFRVSAIYVLEGKEENNSRTTFNPNLTGLKFGFEVQRGHVSMTKPEDKWSCKRSPDILPSKAQNIQNLENIW